MISRHIYRRRVGFIETDAMGIVHHSNFLNLCEEARCSWAKDICSAKPNYLDIGILSVESCQVYHLRPASFDDLLDVHVQFRLNDMSLQFQYRFLREDILIAEAETTHPYVENIAELLSKSTDQHWSDDWLGHLHRRRHICI